MITLSSNIFQLYGEISFLNFKLIGAELYLFISIFLLFMLSLIKSTNNFILMQKATINLSLLILLLSYFLISNQTNYFDLNVYFVDNNFILLIKKIIILILIIIFILSVNYSHLNNNISYEFSILLLVAGWSILLLLNSINLIGIYLLIELQSFCFYILSSSKVKSNFSTEAGLKYFILGSLSSALLLFGISLLYGCTGLTNLLDLKMLFLFDNFQYDFQYQFQQQNENHFLIFSLILILISLLFKLGLVPFHMYVPDVYTGIPTIVTTLFVVIQKLIIFIVYLSLYENIFKYFYNTLNYLLIFSILASIILGSVTALAQSKIKRLIAYSAIVNSGFLMLGITTGTLDGIAASLLFLIIYIVLMLTFFTIYLSAFTYYNGNKLASFKDLILLKKGNLILAVCLSLILFSTAGIPPLAGFYGKLFLFIAAIKEGLYAAAIISIIFTVVTAYYYIKLIKVMFFEKILKFGFFSPIKKFESYIICIGTLFNILFFISPKIIFMYINLLLLQLYF